MTSFITMDCDVGVSALVDVVGGIYAPFTRTISWVLTFDILCLPLFITFGIVYWRVLFPTIGDAGALIGWQILLGLSLNSATAFGAALFSRARISAVSVAGVFLCIAMAGQFYHSRKEPELDISTL
ncbi:hypothetical protein VHEMI04421 [[Torrubiella] hemipterigena]|uniref:Uncharacterized protein n=1 Tax=[Torrubiella] hemipterigena TaxID=1531966 RepID=A0A0A1TDR7_9HYPO|nr:hypothetical protein VHEMI04421 [[Torrubiella] hemipterigena]